MKIYQLVPVGSTLISFFVWIYFLATFAGESLPYPDAPQALLDKQADNLLEIGISLEISFVVFCGCLFCLLVQVVGILKRRRGRTSA